MTRVTRKAKKTCSVLPVHFWNLPGHAPLTFHEQCCEGVGGWCSFIICNSQLIRFVGNLQFVTSQHLQNLGTPKAIVKGCFWTFSTSFSCNLRMESEFGGSHRPSSHAAAQRLLGSRSRAPWLGSLLSASLRTLLPGTKCTALYLPYGPRIS